MDLQIDFTKYSKKQVDFIFAILETGNILKSSKIAGITEATAHKYLQNGLADEINKIRKSYIEENLKRLEYASLKATDVIIDILGEENCPKSIKLNASKTILDYSLKIREQTEIIERLEGIERRIEERESR